MPNKFLILVHVSYYGMGHLKVGFTIKLCIGSHRHDGKLREPLLEFYKQIMVSILSLSIFLKIVTTATRANECMRREHSKKLIAAWLSVDTFLVKFVFTHELGDKVLVFVHF